MFLILVASENVFAQFPDSISDSLLNRHDEKGRKNGYWIAYRRKDIKPVYSKKQAYFYWYIYYNHGGNSIIQLAEYRKNRISENIPDSIKRGEPVALDGRYNSIKKNGKPDWQMVFQNGFLISCLSYTAAGDTAEYADFSPFYRGEGYIYSLQRYSPSYQYDMEVFQRYDLINNRYSEEIIKTKKR